VPDLWSRTNRNIDLFIVFGTVLAPRCTLVQKPSRRNVTQSSRWLPHSVPPRHFASRSSSNPMAGQEEAGVKPKASPRHQAHRVRRCAPWAVLSADAMPATFLLQMLTQQNAGARIEQAHVHRIPLHIDLAADPSRRRSVVSSFHFHTAIQMNSPLSVLVIAERLQRQLLQDGFFFGEHGRHLPLRAAMDARVGPVFFPVIEIRLCLFQSLEALAFQRRLLRMSNAGFDFPFSIRITHLAGQRSHSVVRQYVAIERVHCYQTPRHFGNFRLDRQSGQLQAANSSQFSGSGSTAASLSPPDPSRNVHGSAKLESQTRSPGHVNVCDPRAL